MNLVAAGFDDYFFNRSASGKKKDDMERDPLFYNEVVSKGLVGYLKDQFGGGSDVEAGNSRVIGAIKACNQAVVSPAIIELKMAVGIQNMTKDVKDSWTFDIQVLSPTSVIVSTRKQEQHIQNMFRYSWKLAIHISFVPQSSSKSSNDPSKEKEGGTPSPDALPIKVDKVELEVTDMMFHEFIHNNGKL